MGKTIFITEKPSVAQEYKKVLKISGDKHNGYIEGHSPVLNKDVQITWAVGHLVALGSVAQQNPDWGTKNWKENKKNLPMYKEVKKYKYYPLKNTAEQYSVIKKLYTAKDVDCIYYAGDSGREGMYIQALIRNQIFGFDYDEVENPHCDEKVVWIDSQTEEEILRGIREAKPYRAYKNMVASGYARAISDWLIGMNFTQAFTITSGTLINTGRVKTPTLAMIVDLQDQIDNFKKTDYYGFRAGKNTPHVDAKWKAAKNSKWEDDLYNESGFLKREKAEVLLSEFQADPKLKVEKAERKEKKELAPLLFNLAELQGFCSKAFKISPADTLRYAQELYEEKLITYPRTDSRYLTNAVAKDIEQRVGKKVPAKYIDDSKVTDHYALIPTGKPASGLSGVKEGVYNAIKTRFDAIFMPPYIYDTVSVVYVHSNGERFYESATDVKQMGYKELFGEKKQDVIIPSFKGGEVITDVDFDINAMETKPPTPYTTGSLILAMEKAGKLIEDEELREQLKTCGIGTSATRANIIEELATKGFIFVDKKTQKIAPTDLGRAVIPIVRKFDPQLTSPEKTAEMEQQLQDIVEGKISMDQYMNIIVGYCKTQIPHILSENTEKLSRPNEGGNSGGSTASKAVYKCPKCGKDVVSGKFGWYCKEKCGFYPKQKIYGKELTDKQVESLLAGKQVTMTINGKKTSVLPEIVENEYNGKVYLNWKTEKA